MHVGWPGRTRTVPAVCLLALAGAAGCGGEPASAPPHEPPPAAAPAVTEIAFGPSDGQVTMLAADGKAADLRSKAGMGVSGAGDDFAFDNTAASAMCGAGGRAGGPQLLGAKQSRFHSFTIQGWFRTPAGRPIGGGAVLVGHRGDSSGFELYARTNGTLTLWFGDGLTGRQVVTPQVYTESGRWVFFAVSFAMATKADPDNGVQAAPGRVTFYKGTARTPVRQVHTVASTEWMPVSGAGLGAFAIGARPDGSRAFRGRLDNIRIYHAADGTPPTEPLAGIVNLAALEKLRRTDLGSAALSPPKPAPKPKGKGR